MLEFLSLKVHCKFTAHKSQINTKQFLPAKCLYRYTKKNTNKSLELNE